MLPNLPASWRTDDWDRDDASGYPLTNTYRTSWQYQAVARIAERVIRKGKVGKRLPEEVGPRHASTIFPVDPLAFVAPVEVDGGNKIIWVRAALSADFPPIQTVYPSWDKDRPYYEDLFRD